MSLDTLTSGPGGRSFATIEEAPAAMIETGPASTSVDAPAEAAAPAAARIATASQPPAPRRPRHFFRRLAGAFAAFVLIAAVLFGGGFLLFAADVADSDGEALLRADGIVVLTGGVDRIDRGLRLLSERRAKRMLISGVNAQVTRDELAEQVEADKRRFFTCCVDLGHEALDTIGNAQETSRWAETQGYKSLIVVTSAYHMPRTEMELARAMPDVRLIPYAVHRRSLGGWLTVPEARRMIVAEYLKYLAARLRAIVAPGEAALHLSAARRAEPVTPALASRPRSG